MASLTPRYTFETFVVGSANELAYAAASAVATAPGRAYNPLFLYGGTGLGKTHLMQAVAHQALARRPSLRLRYLPAAEFLAACVDAIALGDLEAFRSAHMNVDLLLLDDVHTLAGRPEVQREFAAVFDTLTRLSRQVMLTSDRPPRDTGIDATLVSRFATGRVDSLSAPTFEHRLAILQSKLALEPLQGTFPPDVLELIAAVASQNIRMLEGALTRLLALARLRRREITLDLAREALRVEYGSAALRDSARTASPAQLIVEAVAREWHLVPEQITGSGRSRAVVLPRQIAMSLCREVARMTYGDIGQYMGQRDHSTVMHAVERAREALEADAALGRRVTALRRSLDSLLRGAA